MVIMSGEKKDNYIIINNSKKKKKVAKNPNHWYHIKVILQYHS